MLSHENARDRHDWLLICPGCEKTAKRIERKRMNTVDGLQRRIVAGRDVRVGRLQGPQENWWVQLMPIALSGLAQDLGSATGLG